MSHQLTKNTYENSIVSNKSENLLYASCWKLVGGVGVGVGGGGGGGGGGVGGGGVWGGGVGGGGGGVGGRTYAKIAFALCPKWLSCSMQFFRRLVY